MSKYIELTEHSNFCTDSDNTFMGNYCELNPSIFVFVLSAEFIVLKSPKCTVYGTEIDYVQSILNQIVDSKKMETNFKLLNINKSITDEVFRDLRIRGIELNKYYYEVNFTYSSASTNYNLITSIELNYKNVINYNEKITNSYNSIKEKIKGVRNEKYILKEIENLYQINKINDWSSDLERIKTVNVLIKKLKKDETSKQ